MNFTKALIALLLGTALGACGGGGNSGSSNVANPYTGNTKQATISSANGSTIATESVSAQKNVGTLGSGTPIRTVSVPSGADIVNKLVLNQVTPTSGTRAVPAGTCGGTVTQMPSGGDATNFSGGMVFADYCEGDRLVNAIVINGTVTFAGTAITTATTTTLTSLTVTYIGVSMVSLPSNEKMTFGGDVTFALDATGMPTGITVSMVVDSAGKSLWLNPYTVSKDSAGVHISGNVYDSVEGYVTITTVQPLAMGATWPTSGQIEIAGAGNTKALLTATPTGYTLSIDTGNGSYGPATSYNWPTI